MNTASRLFGMTISGFPGKSESLLRYVKPAFRKAIANVRSGRVLVDRTFRIIAEIFFPLVLRRARI